MRGKIAIFIDGNNLFHAARAVGVEIDYAKLLNFLRGSSDLLRAFFYTGVDERAERQQGFLLWMRRNGYRVVEKELKTYADGTKKANLDVEIAVDMLSLADKYDTAVLVSGDEDFAYAINAVAYKGVRVELAGFRSNTSPRLIDVADQFIELDSHVDQITKTERHYYHGHGQTGQLQQPGQSGHLYQPQGNSGQLYNNHLHNGNHHQSSVTQPLTSEPFLRLNAESRSTRIVEENDRVRVVEETQEVRVVEDGHQITIVEQSREIDFVEDTVPDFGINRLEVPLNRVTDEN
jgi:uncharacterized LabA/DUF88 family protein